MKRTIVPAIVLVALVSLLPARTAGARGGALTAASAGPFLLHEIAEKTEGHWAAAWRTLYPANQRVAPLAAYVRCEASSPFPASFQGATVEGIKPGPVAVPGLALPVEGVAVAIQVQLAGFFGPRDPIVFRHTFHVVPVAGRWTWLLSIPSYRAYSHGGCAG